MTWNELTNLVEKHYHEPPLAAMRTVYAAARAHYWRRQKPCWLQIVGPPSTGKTELGIYVLSSLPSFHFVGELTPRTFLSGKGDQKSTSLLHRVGDHGLLGFSDFSQLADMPNHERNPITAQLRRIFDGSCEKDVGEGKKLRWHGKVTAVAAVTSAIERYWTMTQALGDRFLLVRWGTKVPSPIELTERLYARMSEEDDPKHEVRRAVKNFIEAAAPDPPEMPKAQRDALGNAAGALTQLRRRIPFDSKGNPGAPDDQEGPSRMIEASLVLCRAHASLFHRPQTEEADVEVAMTVLRDSIPSKRRQLLSLFPPAGTSILVGELAAKTRIPNRTAKREIDALIVLGLVDQAATQGDSTGEYRVLNSYGEELLRAVGLRQTGKVVQIANR